MPEPDSLETPSPGFWRGLRATLQANPGRLRRFDRAAEVLAVVLLLALTLRQGYHLSALEDIPVAAITGGMLIAVMVGRIVLDAIAATRLSTFLRTHGPSILILLLWLIPLAGIRMVAFLLALRILSRAAARALTSARGRDFVVGVQHRPARFIAVTFLILIAVGTLFLSFPGSSSGERPAPLITAFFTATSAVCVTGLITVDTPTYWSTFGQWVILILVQTGGLGIMTLSASAALVLGRGLGAGSRGLLAEVVSETSKRDVTGLIRFIVAFTFVTESVGALILGLHWMDSMPLGEAWYHAVFHSVSAFCNAGFSTFSDSLVGFTGDPVVNAVVGLLIVVGGLGFAVAAALGGVIRKPLQTRQWWRHGQPHMKLVLTTSGILIVAGTLAFFIFEFEASLGGLAFGDKLTASLFQSITLRTAGFNSVPLDRIVPVTATIMMVWMLVGGSPGGTAGGMKTTTLAILAMALVSLLRGRRDVEILGRRIPEETLLKAVAAALLSGVAILGGFLLLLAVEGGTHGYMTLLFEAISAFGTVGLSLGATSSLTPLGQLLIIGLMFVGRTGPLTLAFAMSRSKARSFYRYPEARILVG